MGKVSVKKFGKNPQSAQGKESFKSRKHKSKVSSKSKDRKWVDVKIEELDITLAELRNPVSGSKKDCNNIENGQGTSTGHVHSNELSSRPLNSSSITSETTDNPMPEVNQNKEEFLMPVVGGGWD